MSKEHYTDNEIKDIQLGSVIGNMDFEWRKPSTKPIRPEKKTEKQIKIIKKDGKK